MTETTAILVFSLIALGAYNWHLQTIIQALNEQTNFFSVIGTLKRLL